MYDTWYSGLHSQGVPKGKGGFKGLTEGGPNRRGVSTGSGLSAAPSAAHNPHSGCFPWQNR
jgi:hypothetical protein